MYDKILVPIDGSTLAEGVLPYVRALARAMGVPVELLRVNNLTQLPLHAPPLEGGEYLKKVAASFAGITDVVYRVELGDPAGTIIDLAAAQPSSLIAMATHGYSGARRWLLGSVAEKVIGYAPCPVLVTR